MILTASYNREAINCVVTEAESWPMAEFNERARLLPRDQLPLLQLINPHKAVCFRDREGNLLPFDGIMGKNALFIPFGDDSKETTVEDAKEAYTELFGVITDGLLRARELGKTLVIHGAEWHLQRNSAALLHMLELMMGALSVVIYGIEVPDRTIPVHRDDGKIIPWPSLKDYPAYIAAHMRNGHFVDRDPETSVVPDGLSQNRLLYVQGGLDQGAIMIPTDILFNPVETAQSAFGRREWAMLEEIQSCVRLNHPVWNHCGSGHIYEFAKMMPKIMPDAHALFINGQQAVNTYPPGSDIVYDTSTDPHYIDRALATAGVRIIVQGNVRDLDHAKELAIAVHEQLGGPRW